MAGLSILLEAQKGSYRKGPKIISKTAFLRPTSPSSSSTLTLPATTFLDVCFLCQKRLSPSKDIYMYRGDRAFCSEECRCRQIYLDEESVKRENCSLAAMKPISSSSSSPSSSSSSSSSGALKKNKSRAGGFAY